MTQAAFYVRLALGVAAAAALGWAVWWTTATYYQLQISEAEKRKALEIIIAQQEAAKAAEQGAAITHAINVQAVEARARRAEIALANQQRIATHVTPEVDRLFPLPCGFVRMHDAGARGLPAAAISLPAGKSDGDQCDVAPSVAAGIIQRNYALSLDWKAEVDGWWRWYDQQKATYDAWRAKVADPASR